VRRPLWARRCARGWAPVVAAIAAPGDQLDDPVEEGTEGVDGVDLGVGMDDGFGVGPAHRGVDPPVGVEDDVGLGVGLGDPQAERSRCVDLGSSTERRGPGGVAVGPGDGMHPQPGRRPHEPATLDFRGGLVEVHSSSIEGTLHTRQRSTADGGTTSRRNSAEPGLCQAAVVRPFHGLTTRGQLGRLRGLARSAAGAYGIDVARLTLVGESFNTLFRIRSGSGATYLLRVGSALRLHPQGSGEVEAAWLDELGRATGIPVARVFRNLDGGVVTEVVSPGVPEPRTCMLFSWIPGRVVAERLDPEVATRSGRLSAELHAHAAGSDLSGGAAPVADRVLYWEDPRSLDGVPRYGTLFSDAAARAQALSPSAGQRSVNGLTLLYGGLTLQCTGLLGLPTRRT